MEWIKEALVARKQRELTEQLQRAGEALAGLVQNDAVLKDIPPEAAWTMLNALRTGLRGLEQATRVARSHDVPAGARQALGEVAYALGAVTDVLERYGVPAAENMYGFEPRGSRWHMGPAERSD